MKPTYLIAAHPIQQAILEAVAAGKLKGASLRATATIIGAPKGTSPQKIAHHLNAMVGYGFLDIVGGEYRVGRVLRRSR